MPTIAYLLVSTTLLLAGDKLFLNVFDSILVKAKDILWTKGKAI
ncbi:hypothetical protein [Nafulsella turpanensis]|nr:hypothetical protein [Nafulsella turpanensis]